MLKYLLGVEVMRSKWRIMLSVSDFRKCTNCISNIMDQKSGYRSHRKSVVLAMIEYPGYLRVPLFERKGDLGCWLSKIN